MIQAIVEKIRAKLFRPQNVLVWYGYEFNYNKHLQSCSEINGLYQTIAVFSLFCFQLRFISLEVHTNDLQSKYHKILSNGTETSK